MLCVSVSELVLARRRKAICYGSLCSQDTPWISFFSPFIMRPENFGTIFNLLVCLFARIAFIYFCLHFIWFKMNLSARRFKLIFMRLASQQHPDSFCSDFRNPCKLGWNNELSCKESQGGKVESTQHCLVQTSAERCWRTLICICSRSFFNLCTEDARKSLWVQTNYFRVCASIRTSVRLFRLKAEVWLRKKTSLYS